MNYESLEYEWIDENGFSIDQEELVFDYDRTVFDTDNEDCQSIYKNIKNN